MTRLVAPAKLTWYLEITGRRPNGFHELRSEMVTLGLADHLDIDVEGDYLRIEPPTLALATDQENLVNRALRLVDRRAGVTLHKSIPSGGGLGGGSADAGAILRWAGGVDSERALTLGADVPFCQIGGRALVEGVGEVVTALPFELRRVTLFMPDFAVNTADCFRAYDAVGNQGSLRNHLERAAGVVEPRLATTLAWLRREFSADIHLAGSGSTMFMEGHLREGTSSWDVKGPEGTLRIHETTTTPR